MGNWLDIDGKVVVITGGSSGIGRRIVESLLENGAIVYNADMKDNPLDHKGYHYVETDVTQEDNVKKSVGQIVDEQKQIDILINNAGINLPRILVDVKGEKPEYEINTKDLDLIFAVNLK